jgi:hypothetical protein
MRVEQRLITSIRPYDKNPRFSNALTDQARLVKGSLDEAIAAHRKAVELEPDNAVFNYNLGVAYGDKGSPDGRNWPTVTSVCPM